MALHRQHLVLQLAVILQRHRRPQVHHRLEDVLVQLGGGLHVAALGGGVLQKGDLLVQGLQGGLVVLGLAVPVDHGHGLAHAHLLTLAAGELHNAVLGGEHLLLPHQQALRLHAVVDDVGVDQSGGEGVVEGIKDMKAEVDGQRRSQRHHDNGDDRFALLHIGSLSLSGGGLPPAGYGWPSPGVVRGMGRSGTMVEMACL